MLPDVKRLGELSVIITSLQKAKEELMEMWFNHTEGCMYLSHGWDDLDENEMGCTHPTPSCDPVCMYDGCPLLRKEGIP